MQTPDLFFLHAGHMPRCTVRMGKYFDGYHTLQFMAGGAVELSFDQRAYSLAGQWLWTQYPGPFIRLQPGRDTQCWDHRYVAFRGPMVNRWVAEQLLVGDPQPMPDGLDYVSLFDQLLAAAGRTDRRGNLLATNLLERILLDLAEHRTQQQPIVPWLDKVLSLIENSPTAELDYYGLADQLGLGLSTLRNGFKKATGTSIHNYVLQYRMAKARRLLGETDLPIKAIARKLGYKDVFYFSRQFAQHVGSPPGQYRKSRQV